MQDCYTQQYHRLLCWLPINGGAFGRADLQDTDVLNAQHEPRVKQAD
jgi:hypothetical protein